MTDPISGNVTVLQAESEVDLDAQVDRLLAAGYPLPLASGAGDAVSAAAVRVVLRAVTGLVGSTRLLDVRNLDGRLVRIEIGCGNSPRFNDLQVVKQLERRLTGILSGGWQARWLHNTGSLLIIRREGADHPSRHPGGSTVAARVEDRPSTR